mgnify:CR=1 FL=1
MERDLEAGIAFATEASDYLSQRAMNHVQLNLKNVLVVMEIVLSMLTCQIILHGFEFLSKALNL